MAEVAVLGTRCTFSPSHNRENHHRANSSHAWQHSVLGIQKPTRPAAPNAAAGYMPACTGTYTTMLLPCPLRPRRKLSMSRDEG